MSIFKLLLILSVLMEKIIIEVFQDVTKVVQGRYKGTPLEICKLVLISIIHIMKKTTPSLHEFAFEFLVKYKPKSYSNLQLTNRANIIMM